MKSRMEKYYQPDHSSTPSRTSKNKELYQEITTTDIDKFNVNSNVSVLGDNETVIDVNKLRDMLDRKYREEPKRKSIPIEATQEDMPIQLDETREYDINSILEKAREDKPVDYEKDRFKKIRDTQYDILKSLDLTITPRNKSEAVQSNEERLMELIETITLKEDRLQEAGADPLDILSDLKGSDQTEVIAGVRDEINKTMIAQAEKQVSLPSEKVTSSVDKSFYTNSMNFTQSDFDDFNDLKEEVKSHKVIIKLLIAIIIVVFLFGIFVLLNNFLGWGIL